MRLLSRLFAAKAAPQPAAPSAPGPDLAALLGAGDAAYQAGERARARQQFARALEIDARNAHAQYMLGALALQDGDTQACMTAVRRAIELAPERAEYHFSLGNVHAAAGRTAEAIDCYRNAVRLSPGAQDWRDELAITLAEAGRLAEATQAQYPDAGGAGGLYDLASMLMERGRLAAAAAAFRESIRLEPGAAASHLMLAVALRDQGMPVEAEAPAREAVALAPDMPEGWFMLGHVLSRQARHEDAVEHYRKAIELAPDYDAAWRCLVFAMNYSERWTPREVFDAHLESARRFPRTAHVSVGADHLRPGHRLRIGYLSGDLRRHPVAYFLEPVLRHHDHGRFEVFCYHTGADEDDLSARLRAHADHWRAVGRLSPDDLDRTLRADRLDLLVELSGHSDGHRLAVVARRVAPVQVSYLGYPNTTGLTAIDYRITDAQADPPGEADALHTERLARLPETFLCYAPPFAGEVAARPPVCSRGRVTFGSFNNFAKLSASNIALWARVLDAVPGATLFIKTGGLQDPGLRRLVLERFRAAGIDSSRLELAAPTDSIEAHMRSYDRVDIALDSFPYHGTTTTMDALWMGVPVVTLRGDRHAARVSASILHTLGLDQMVAASAQDYVQIARRLALDVAGLETLRRTLRQRLQASPLMDGVRFTRHLEEAYLRMWQAALATPAAESAGERGRPGRA
ncbi:MAG TPA: tetratricopeptide repeat protein [Burkholderiales bacterium]|nr:tetratricopeptide repeat protein [Burkholderiales bacterium]